LDGIAVEEDEKGPDGNPFVNPYPFRISWDKNQIPSKQYSAVARPGTEPSDKIKELFAQAPPDLTNEVKPDDVDSIMNKLRPYLVCDKVSLGGESKGNGKSQKNHVVIEEDDEDEEVVNMRNDEDDDDLSF
jgi:hypothetical protein